jgi:hypothetical protein
MHLTTKGLHYADICVKRTKIAKGKHRRSSPNNMCAVARSILNPDLQTGRTVRCKFKIHATLEASHHAGYHHSNSNAGTLRQVIR